LLRLGLLGNLPDLEMEGKRRKEEGRKKQGKMRRRERKERRPSVPLSYIKCARRRHLQVSQKLTT
jgi:hypothetical protein